MFLSVLIGGIVFVHIPQVRASTAHDSRLEDLMATIVDWLSVNFDLPASYKHPLIRFEPNEQISQIRYGSRNAEVRPTVIAVYEDKTATIFLSDSWHGESQAEISILVHEMVHHLQNLAKATYACPQEREALAYAAQDRWLSMFGRRLDQEFKISPIALKFATQCLKH